MKPRNPSIELKAAWSKSENSVMIYYPNKPDGGLLWSLLCSERYEWGLPSHFKDNPKSRYMCDLEFGGRQLRSVQSIVDLLDERGYDVTTLKFSIKKKGWENE